MLMERELTINKFVCGHWFLSLIALLLMSVEMQAEETSTTYTFTGMSAVSGEDYQYEVTSTSGEASETWKIKNFSATDENYNVRSSSGYVLETQSLGISNIFATSTSATIIDFQLVSDFVLHGDFVSAEITYSTSGMSNSKAVVCKVGNSSYSMLTDTSEPLGTSPATISLKSLYEDEKYFNDQKVALDFTFITNKSDGYDGAFSIQSVKITTTPATEVYNLWVGGVQVNSGNASNILNDDNNPTAVFDVSTNTLTLNNATINGNVVSGLADDLTAHLVGTNTINTQGTKAFVSTLQSEPSLTFTAANGGLLKTNIPRTQGDAVISSGFSDNIPEDYKMSWDADGFCSLGQYYGLYLYTFVNDNSYFQPYYVTAANCDRLMGKYNESNNSWDNTVITISYDDSEKTLTLNNASPESAAPYGETYLINCEEANAKNITIMLLGENTLRQYPNVDAAGFIRNSQYEGTITITTNLENPGTLTMPDLGEYSEESDVLSADNVIYKNGLGYSKDENNVRYIKTLPGYGLTVAGITVNSSNADNVLGDDLSEEGSVASVSFDATTNTLTLNEAYINVEGANAIESSLANLKIFLVGESYLYCYGNGNQVFAFSKGSDVENVTVTFTTDEESNGILNLVEDNLFGEGVTPVYTNVLNKRDGDYGTITSQLGVRVAGIDVTLFNKGNVLGDGKVSYNAETYTLTLNNATIEPEEETSGIDFSHDENFTIALIGNNSVRGGEGCTAISHSFGVETPYVYFVKGDAAQHFSLTLIAQSENELIDGFYANYGDFFVFDEEDDGTYTSTISTTAFGGTGSADEPFLIKTADDLKKFAYHYNEGRFSNNVHIQLFNDIDCENEEGFTTIADNTDATFYGVFDGNHKTISNLTMTGVGLFGNVSKDDDFGVGIIKDLTLSNFHITGNDYATGGIVAELSGGAVVSHCTVTNSTIACGNNQYNPEVGAIVARLYGSTVTGCTVNNVKVKAETSYLGGSGPASSVGGIVGNASEGIVDSCAVTNGSKITNYYADEYATLNAGAIVGNQYETTFSENFYDFDVKVEKLNGTNAANKIVKSGYEQRGVGGESYNEQTEEMEANPDILEDNGVVMYTQKVALPEETDKASVIGEEGTYYSTVVESDVLSILVAPGQPATLNAMPGEGYAVSSLTATNTTTGATISTSPVYLGDNITQYSFTMPDAPVTVAVVTVQTIGIRVAGVEVTEQNSANVLGDGKVSYDEETSTLTLNKATINGCIYLYGESKNSLTVHLVGENIIDGGYVSQDENGDWAFGTSVEKAKLSITTDETNPGQLLLRNCYINKWNNAEYYDGWYPALKNGLTETENYNDNKVLIAQGPVLTPGQGIYWTDQLYTFTDGAEVAFRDNEGHTLEVSVNENSFTLPETRKYTIEVSKTKTVDNTEFYMYSGGHYTVYNKPGFSIPAGTYNGPQSIKLTNLPTLPEDPSYYPQVWYYLDDNKNDSVQYTSAQQEIELMESAKVCVYFLDEDSDKLKSAPVEAEYVILQQPGYHFSDSESGQSYYSSGSTVYNLDFGQENTLPWLINVPAGLTITYASEDENVATIDQAGKITLTGAGHVWLTASNEETAEYAAHTERIRLEIRPTDPQASLIEGAYYVGQKVTLIPTVPNGTIYYSFGWSGEKTKYTEGDEIVLPKGEYEFYTYTRCVTEADDSETDYMQSYGNNHRYYYVYDQPTFSVEDGTYNDDVNVKIENLPNTNSAQVYYYFYDETQEPEDEEGVLYHADDVITMTESKILKAYIVVEGDSGKKYRTEPVEAEYTIIAKTQLNISYAQNSREWASYCASENSLETPDGLQAYVVKQATKMGVQVEKIDYIPQGVAVLLKRTAEVAEPIVAKAYMEAEPEAPTNKLVGTTTSTSVRTLKGSVYVLYNDGFTRATSGAIGANRGYLLFDETVAAGARLSIFEDETTAVENVNRETLTNNQYYNLNGQRVVAPKKNGLYIVNGQKKIVK